MTMLKEMVPHGQHQHELCTVLSAQPLAVDSVWQYDSTEMNLCIKIICSDTFTVCVGFAVVQECILCWFVC